MTPEDALNSALRGSLTLEFSSIPDARAFQLRCGKHRRRIRDLAEGQSPWESVVIQRTGSVVVLRKLEPLNITLGEPT